METRVDEDLKEYYQILDNKTYTEDMDIQKLLYAYREKINNQNRALEAFFEKTDCGLLRHTIDGREVRSINQAALRILGYESQQEMEADGFNMIADSVYEDDKEKLRDSIRKLKKVGDSTSVEYRVEHKDGNIIEVIGRIKLLEENNELIYQRFLFDYTEERNIEKRENKAKEKHHQELINALSLDYSSVYYLDLDTSKGYSYRVKQEIVDRFGSILTGNVTLQSAMSFYAAQLIAEEDREMFLRSTTKEHMQKELDEKLSFSINYRTKRPDGAEEYYQMRAVRVGTWGKHHNVVIGFRSVDEDIREEMEQKRTLSDALQQARQASGAKTAFLNNMSHDIRTPMNAIIGFTALAMTHIDDKELVRDYLGKIMTSSNHLLSLINDVLDMSRIESGKMKIEEQECDIYDIAEELENILMPDIQTRQQDFKVELKSIRNRYIICDKLRLNQILLNCLSNAVKFTGMDGAIRLIIMEMPSKDEETATYIFRVRDNGIGMSPEFAKHVFEPFERERTSTVSGTQGTGLGMAITKNIVDMMGGQISVNSRVGVGTEFIIELPFKITENCHKDDTTCTEPEEHIPFEGNHILLVEDVDLNREIAEVLLNEAGFEVDSVVNGAEAVDRIKDSDDDEYNLILMDIQMPVMDGYEACRQIRKLNNPKKSHIPILAMTANAFEEDKRMAYEAGMDGHLSKPIQIQDLYREVKSHLR